MKQKISFAAQKLVLFFSYHMFRLLKNKTSNNIDWVVGVSEIAACLHYISCSLKNSVSVCLFQNAFYAFKYDYPLPVTPFGIVNKFLDKFYGAVLLGYLMNNASGFLYIWENGFLVGAPDGRKFEFWFLKKHGKKIACYFCGNDIRAPRLEIELGKKLGLDVASNYYHLFVPELISDDYDQRKRAIAQVADQYADFVFNADVDHASYLERPSLPIFNFLPEECFCRNPDKFQNIEKIRILHAPSSPIVKGTQVVRAAIKKLEVEGYNFDYIEVQNSSNSEILEHLRSTHIVLNEFYMFMPGIFGIEAMASYCVLMTSADEYIEPALPRNSNRAWIVTRYYEVYENLKYLLDNPSQLVGKAEAGYQWVVENAAVKSSGRKLSEILGGR